MIKIASLTISALLTLGAGSGAILQNNQAAYSCEVQTCSQVQQHSHSICSIAECTQSVDHEHDGIVYLAQNDSSNQSADLDAANFECVISGCTQTVEHEHCICNQPNCTNTTNCGRCPNNAVLSQSESVTPAAESQSENTTTAQAYDCDVPGCDNTEQHSHTVCAVSGCNQTTNHVHNGTAYYGHNANDGHAYHNCGTFGCLQNGSRAHNCENSECPNAGNHSGQNSGHHAGRVNKR